MSRRAVDPSYRLGRGVAPARVVRGVAWETRSDDERRVSRVGLRLWIIVGRAGSDGRDGTPVQIEILGCELRDEAVARRDADEREITGVLRERISAGFGELPRRRAEQERLRRGRV